MSRTILISIVFFASTSFAADSSVLREIMGKSVYDDSGINGLSSEQLQVLEKWILEYADETLLVEKAEPQTAPPDESNEAYPSRYVKLAEQQEASAEEEPVTQAYVRIDRLEAHSRSIQPDLIQSRIDGTFKGWRGKTRFKLENGEIWQQRQSGTYITTLESPDVVIRKGRMNFYTMEVPEIGRKVHVKRIR